MRKVIQYAVGWALILLLLSFGWVSSRQILHSSPVASDSVENEVKQEEIGESGAFGSGKPEEESPEEQVPVEEITEEESQPESFGVFVVTQKSANIRKGAGTDNKVVTTAHKEDRFDLTGKQKDVDGRVWYKIYLDEGHEKTGWISEAVGNVEEAE